VLPGFALGVLNIMLTKRVLAKYDDLTVPHMKAQDVRKVILIVSPSFRVCMYVCLYVYE
jgi:hypothetical protein